MEKDNLGQILLAIGRLEGSVAGMKDTFASELKSTKDSFNSLSRDIYADLKSIREAVDRHERRIPENYQEFDHFRTKITTSFTILMAVASIIGGIVSTIGYLLIDKFFIN